jgi:two-component system chemotaxis response regulator CheB
VVLSGALGDGASGAKAVAAAGGQVLVQDPDDATVPSMPESTLAAVGDAAEIVSADLLGSRLAALVQRAPEEEDLLVPAFDDPRELPDDRPDGPPTGLTCPECGGPLWEVEERRYRCRVGHAYSELAFVSAQADSVEAALYVALETLEERAELLRRIARRPGTMRPVNRDNMEAAARDALSRADLIRTALATTGRGADTFDIDSEPAA